MPACCRRRGRRELRDPHRPAVRDHRRPRARARHPARAAVAPARAPHRARARPHPGGDARLFRFQQGRRLPLRQLGAVQGADCAGARRPHVRYRDRLFPRPRRLGQPRRRARRPRHRGPAGRLRRRPPAHDRARRGRLRPLRQPRHRARPYGTAGGQRAQPQPARLPTMPRRAIPNSTRPWRRSPASPRPPIAGSPIIPAWSPTITPPARWPSWPG